MRLVEGVACEWFNEREYLLSHLPGVALTERAFEEVLLLLNHDLGNLLAHRLSHDVRLTERVSGESARNLQDLVLINDDAVCLFEHVLQRGMRVVRGDAAVLGIDKGGYVLHRTGSVERNHGCDIAQ